MIGRTELDDHIPTITANKVLGALKARLQLARLSTTDFGEEFKNFGDTVEVPVRGALTVSDKTDAGDYTVQAPADTKVSLTLNKWKEITLRFADPARVMAKGSPEEGYAVDAGIGIAEQIEKDVLALYASLTNTIGSAGVAITYDNYVGAREKLIGEKVSPLADIFAIWRHSEWSNLLKIDKLTKANEKGAGAPIVTGDHGFILGVRNFENQLVTQTGSAPTSTHNIMGTRDAFGLVSRPLPLPEANEGANGGYAFDPDIGIAVRVVRWWNGTKGARQWTTDCLYGVGVVREKHAVRVLT